MCLQSSRNLIFTFLLLFPLANSYSAESDVYTFKWLDPDKKVFVLQNRKYRKVKKFHFSLSGGMTTNGAFVDSYAVQGRAGFFVTEQFGFEGLYAKNFGEENATGKSVRNEGGAGSVPFRRITDNYLAAFFLWSPFYAKINTFNKIIYFDWIIGLGAGKLKENNNRDEFKAGGVGSNTDTLEEHNAIAWETGVKFFLSEMFSIRADLTVLHYKAEKAVSNTKLENETWYSHYDLTIGLTVDI